MIIRSFILVSRLPAHQVADRRVMQIQVRRSLLLSITVFLNGFNDPLVPFYLILHHLLGEDLIETRPAHKPVALGNLRNVLAILDMRDLAPTLLCCELFRMLLLIRGYGGLEIAVFLAGKEA
jgi:hypothetical protein